jgi:hypothetical protein
MELTLVRERGPTKSALCKASDIDAVFARSRGVEFSVRIEKAVAPIVALYKKQ